MHDLEAAIIIFYARHVSQHSLEKKRLMLDEMFKQNFLLLVFQKYNNFFSFSLEHLIEASKWFFFLKSAAMYQMSDDTILNLFYHMMWLYHIFCIMFLIYYTF